MTQIVLLLLTGVGLVRANDLVLATFGDDSLWTEMNDPVMGGSSSGNWSIINGNIGLFQGTVTNVSFLSAPGFCQTSANIFANASAYGGIALKVRSSTPDYKGFKFAFSAIGAPRHHGGHELQGSYKTSFAATSDWTTVTLNFNQFSSDWSDYTGDCDTKDPDGYQHVCCSEENAQVCPDATRLARIDALSLWAEGTEGAFHLEILSINATNQLQL
mmetsp:Transcript_13268/g.17716  ORF Transcript_13268/g.17716 Transcript_13268/m.17716 type:complete len:216 (-) Transcript_13268:84-731(-)|eukprot:CAMPEP_0197289402 /NCGR_PEP_ID=MMETSP0890-20130614/6655_1 /TAXON_ID=44058 ORGANISM="Aureoumbra lagunensis, Strain CCMP1510" /NCGR_SAMPLE_ID=MMETSP0890 /ASSEMBLY_ACC=CAM_ASM_000533 /LENGTH=215 /DNA_ID=CAMNT_0042760797 /DNA_START=36 /DNA_END=683 /DNA_ORIENTATION=+